VRTLPRWQGAPEGSSDTALYRMYRPVLLALMRRPLLSLAGVLVVFLKSRSEMKVIGFITEPRVIRRMIDHLEKRTKAKRGPPASTTAVASAPA